MAKLLGGTTIYGTATVQNILYVGTGTGAASTNTGDLQVAGGIGVGGGLYVGGTITATNVVAQNLYIDYTTVTQSLVTSPDIFTITNTTQSIGTTTGALTVVGGAGIGKNVFVGGNLTATNVYANFYGNVYATNSSTFDAGFATTAGFALSFNTGTLVTTATYASYAFSFNTSTLLSSYTTGTTVIGYAVTATNVTGGAAGSLLYQTGFGATTTLPIGSNGQVLEVVSNNPAWTSLGQLTVGTANTSTNIAGGTQGSIPIQANSGTTAFIPIGTSGQILQSNGNTATWITVSGLSAGVLNTTTNIANGQANQIPYQSAPGSTTFSPNLTFNGFVFTTTDIVVTDTTPASTNTYASGALQVAGGVGIGGGLFVGGTITATNIVTQILTVDYTTVTQSLVTSPDIFTITNVTAAVSTATGALTVAGGVGIGGSLYTNRVNITSTLSNTSSYANNALYVAGGIGGNSGMNINGASYFNGSLYVTGVVTATNISLTTIIANSGTFYGNSIGANALYAGVFGYNTSTFSQTIFQATGNYNGYMEIDAQNVNSGNQASTDIIANADIGTNSSGFIDMGITSSQWDGTQVTGVGTVAGATDGYLLVGQNPTTNTGNLILATATTGSNIKFLVAAPNTVSLPTSAQISMIVNAVSTPSTNTGTGALVVYGGAGVGQNLNVGGNLNVKGNIVSTGTVQHSGLVATYGTNIDQIFTTSTTLTLTTNWQNTGIAGTELPTGSYIVQCLANDSLQGGGEVNTYYTGVMSWYSSSDTESSFDEITLHRAGSASGAGTIFLQVLRNNGGTMSLQIAGTTNNSSASTYNFSFRRMI